MSDVFENGTNRLLVPKNMGIPVFSFLLCFLEIRVARIRVARLSEGSENGTNRFLVPKNMGIAFFFKLCYDLWSLYDWIQKKIRKIPISEVGIKSNCLKKSAI